MSMMPRFIPDAECVQSKCANATTGCRDVCMMRNPGWVVAPDTPVARNRSPYVLGVKPSNWDQQIAATLPAAPAPTRATAEQEAEINAAVKAGRIVFEPGWNDPRPAPAPTEQASIAPMSEGGRFTPDADKFIDLMRTWRFAGLGADAARAFAAVVAHVNEFAAALAARQAPTEDEFAKIMSDANVTNIACMMGNMVYNLAQKKGHILTAADCEIFDNLRKQWDAARRAPNSRDAARLAHIFNVMTLAQFCTIFNFDMPPETTTRSLRNLDQWAREQIDARIAQEKAQ